MEETSSHVGATRPNDELGLEPIDRDAAFLRRRDRPEYIRKTPESLRVVDLFGGCGGMTLGIAEASRVRGRFVDIVMAMDFDEDAVTVYNENFGVASNRTPACAGDVAEVFGEFSSPLSKREREIQARSPGGIDILVGGPPCQGHSDLNNHTRRNDPRNQLYLKMARAAEVLRPHLVVIENVRAVVHDTNGVVEKASRQLREFGYDVASLVAHMEFLGVPQTRRRHLLVATLGRDTNSAQKVVERLAKAQETLPPLRTVRWAIDDLASIEPTRDFDRPSTATEVNRQRIRWLFENNEYVLDDSERPPCHRDNEHTYTSVYGRMRPNRPAPTITTGFGSMGQGCFVHPTRRRTITPHEAARLQTFPDFFRFDHTITKRGAWAKLIGNAVPPLLMRRIVETWFDVRGEEAE